MLREGARLFSLVWDELEKSSSRENYVLVSLVNPTAIPESMESRKVLLLLGLAACTGFLFYFGDVNKGAPREPEEKVFEPAENSVSRQSGIIAEGTDWATDYMIIDSGVEGSTVLIVGGMHGNEPAGSLAAEQISHWPISRGKLIVIPRANILGLQAETRLIPGQPTESADLNRNFPQIGEEAEMTVTPRGELAAALWNFAFKARPDWVIDLHEGFDFNRSHKPADGGTRSVGSSVIYKGSPEMDELIPKVVAAANASVLMPERRFSIIRTGPVSTGLARACINVIGAEGLILETTYNGQPISLRTQQHRAMVNVLLNHIGTIDGDFRNNLATEGTGLPSSAQ